MKLTIAIVMIAIAISLPAVSFAQDKFGESGFAMSGDVKIHYVTMGKGPLAILIHGFPDYWYSWRDQMPDLAKHFQVVAIDQRGYNKSDQPKGVENYTVDKLVGDVEAVIKHFQKDRAIIVRHDWGGAVAWRLTMGKPDVGERRVARKLQDVTGV